MDEGGESSKMTSHVTSENSTIDVQLLALRESSGAALYGMLEVLSTAGQPVRDSKGMDPAPITLAPRIVSGTVTVSH